MKMVKKISLAVLLLGASNVLVPAAGAQTGSQRPPFLAQVVQAAQKREQRMAEASKVQSSVDKIAEFVNALREVTNGNQARAVLSRFGRTNQLSAAGATIALQIAQALQTAATDSAAAEKLLSTAERNIATLQATAKSSDPDPFVGLLNRNVAQVARAIVNSVKKQQVAAAAADQKRKLLAEVQAAAKKKQQDAINALQAKIDELKGNIKDIVNTKVGRGPDAVLPFELGNINDVSAETVSRLKGILQLMPKVVEMSGQASMNADKQKGMIKAAITQFGQWDPAVQAEHQIAYDALQQLNSNQQYFNDFIKFVFMSLILQQCGDNVDFCNILMDNRSQYEAKQQALEKVLNGFLSSSLDPIVAVNLAQKEKAFAAKKAAAAAIETWDARIAAYEKDLADLEKTWGYTGQDLEAWLEQEIKNYKQSYWITRLFKRNVSGLEKDLERIRVLKRLIESAKEQQVLGEEALEL